MIWLLIVESGETGYCEVIDSFLCHDIRQPIPQFPAKNLFSQPCVLDTRLQQQPKEVCCISYALESVRNLKLLLQIREEDAFATLNNIIPQI